MALLLARANGDDALPAWEVAAKGDDFGTFELVKGLALFLQSSCPAFARVDRGAKGDDLFGAESFVAKGDPKVLGALILAEVVVLFAPFGIVKGEEDVFADLAAKGDEEAVTGLAAKGLTAFLDETTTAALLLSESLVATVPSFCSKGTFGPVSSSTPVSVDWGSSVFANDGDTTVDVFVVVSSGTATASSSKGAVGGMSLLFLESTSRRSSSCSSSFDVEEG